jgi:hypothetical protein
MKTPTHTKKKKLCRDKKKRAPKHQPICGLYALAMCFGRKLKTAQQVEYFRNECRQAGVFKHRTAGWVGGTNEGEHKAACKAFGFEHTPVQFDLKAQTVGRLFKHADFFKTKSTWLLCVCNHCLFVQTNKTKTKMFVMDQRGKKMHIDDDTKYMAKLKTQKLRSLAMVDKKEDEVAQTLAADANTDTVV